MAHKTLAEALIAAQAEMPQLIKDSTNPHFKNDYISLGGVLDQVLPKLREHGILVMQLPSHIDGRAALTTSFIHPASADHIEATTPLWAAKEDAPGQGSAITYMRRYAIMSALALVAANEDDDGLGATNKSKAKPKPAAASGSGTNDDDLGF